MSSLYERIKELCEIKGVSPSRMCIDCGMHPSFVCDLKAGRKKGMSATTAEKVANYFGVTVSYLLNTPENKKLPTIANDSEQQLLDLFRAANPQLKALVLGALASGVPSQPSQGVGEADE
ncbi:MAG: helix-turn-helix transcriptional regulator [Phascolarctobacterium sp.]|nr:helix-turn-helix transcriptional regulator [Candidatus Phascolarctobacterium caballi]